VNAYQEKQVSGIQWPAPAFPSLYRPSQVLLHWQKPEQPPAAFEDLERQMEEFAVEHAAMLDDLRRHYILPADSSVTDFLTEHRSIPQILLGAVPHLLACFGTETIFNLRAPIDDSGSQTLYATAVWPGKSQDVRHALDRFDQEWWMERAGQAAGYLTFTYELV